MRRVQAPFTKCSPWLNQLLPRPPKPFALQAGSCTCGPVPPPGPWGFLLFPPVPECCQLNLWLIHICHWLSPSVQTILRAGITIWLPHPSVRSNSNGLQRITKEKGPILNSHKILSPRLSLPLPHPRGSLCFLTCLPSEIQNSSGGDTVFLISTCPIPSPGSSKEKVLNKCSRNWTALRKSITVLKLRSNEQKYHRNPRNYQWRDQSQFATQTHACLNIQENTGNLSSSILESNGKLPRYC